MELILAVDVPSLGKAGEIVKVKPGYGRNYLIPQKKALLASSQNLKSLNAQKRVIAAFKARAKGSAETVAAGINSIHLTIRAAVGENERLFGSVTKMDLIAALKEQGVELDKHQLELEHPIKTIGEHEIPVKLHSEVQVSFKVSVLPEE